MYYIILFLEIMKINILSVCLFVDFDSISISSLMQFISQVWCSSRFDQGLKIFCHLRIYYHLILGL